VLDYATVGLTAAAPALLGLSGTAATTCRALAGSYLGLSLLTDYPLSARRVVPFPAHGALEVGLGLALPFLPRVLGFERDRAATALLYGLTAVTAVVAALTDWTGAQSPPEAR
jgi:hypothetical protein